MLPGCTLLILAGGSSRRMGRDKATLDAGNGTILDQLLTRLVPLVEEAIVAGPPTTEAPGARVVADQFPGSGPLAGMQAGLLAATRPWVWVVAGDLPDADAAVGRFLLDRVAGVEAVVPRLRDQPDPLCAVYDRRIVPRITELLETGQRSVTGLLARCRVRYISAAELRAVDPDLRSFRNLNTPDEYQAWLRARRGGG